MDSDFGYKLNLCLAMLRQNVRAVGVTVNGELYDLPMLSEDVLTGQLGIDEGIEILQRLCAAYPAECKLAAAQIERADAAFGVDGEASGGSDVTRIITASGGALAALISAFTNKSTTTTTNTNMNTSSVTSTASSSSASLYVGCSLALGLAVIVALAMRK